MSNILFGLNIAQIVNDSIGQAGGVLSGTLTKVTPGTRTPGNLTGGTNPSEVPYPFQGFVSNSTQVRINGSLTTVNDQFVSILGASLPDGIEPGSGDKIFIENTNYTVIELTDRDPAKALYTVSVEG